MKRKLTQEHKMKLSKAALVSSRRKKAKVPDLLTALAMAVSARYDDAGDRTMAGIHISCIGINGERSLWYAAVKRYYDEEPVSARQGMAGHVVCNVRVEGTAQDAVAKLAQSWFGMARADPGVLATQKVLKAALPPATKEAP